MVKSIRQGPLETNATTPACFAFREYCFFNPPLFDPISNLRSLTNIYCFSQEDAHVANSKFNNNVNEALFSVFDGHGGREVAVYSKKHYENILVKDIKMAEKDV